MTPKGEISLVSLRAYDVVENATCPTTKFSMNPILSAAFTEVPTMLTVEAALNHTTNSIARLLHVQ